MLFIVFARSVPFPGKSGPTLVADPAQGLPKAVWTSPSTPQTHPHSFDADKDRVMDDQHEDTLFFYF